MKKFMGEDFLLKNKIAEELYHAVKDLPIIDYHCHLEPKDIAENRRFKNITELWLGGDHYKWRLMRANGVDESFITGNAQDYVKFEKWCETIEDCIGSPLYHWTHLELKRYFGYDGLLSKKSAQEVWEFCNQVIQDESFSVWSILEKFHVEALCTTDDPADSLEFHKKIRDSGLGCKVLPTFRPGRLLQIEDNGYTDYIKKLSGLTGSVISCYDDLRKAMKKRVQYFHENGCRLSDHSLDNPFFEEAGETELNDIFQKALNGKSLTAKEINMYKTGLLLDTGRQYHELGWVMQLHMCPMRNNNTKMYLALGSDAGFDSISDISFAAPLSRLLDALEREDKLPKTILYSLNPSADDMLASMAGNFQGGGVKGKIQYGSAWWFNDTKTGMVKQMTTLANMGMLSRFVGMLTDSRSFLSYTRHEYFRRIMVGLLSGWAEEGEFPEDMEKLKEIAGNISYYNAKEYFGFD